MSLEINQDDFSSYSQDFLNDIFGIDPKDPKSSIGSLYSDSSKLNGNIRDLWAQVHQGVKAGVLDPKPIARLQVNLYKLEETVSKLEKKIQSASERAHDYETYQIEIAVNLIFHKIVLLKDQVKLSRTQFETMLKQSALIQKNKQINGLKGKEQAKAFEEILTSQYKIIDNRGQGNCGLYSIAKSMYTDLDQNTEDTVIAQLRASAVKYMRDHRKDFEIYCKEDPRNYNRTVTFEEYLKIMSQSGTYISGQELKALSQVLQRPIYVYTPGGTTVENGQLVPRPYYRYGSEYSGKEPAITLYFQSSHYKTLMPQ
jgi:hypothetical protein